MAYHGAVALLYQGMQAEEQQKMGERVAYYQAAVDMLKEASKLAKNLDQQEVSLKFSFWDLTNKTFFYLNPLVYIHMFDSWLYIPWKELVYKIKHEDC